MLMLYMYVVGIKEGCQPINKLPKNEKSDFPADSHNIQKRWIHFFSYMLKVRRISNVRRSGLHIAESTPVEITTGKFKRPQSPGIEVPTYGIQAGDETLGYEV